MDITAPQGFWERYKQELFDLKLSQRLWRSDSLWTAITRDAAKNIIEKQELETTEDVSPNDAEPRMLVAQTEYFRVDVIGYERIEDCDWRLRIAFEHENGLGRWKQELCKLTHVVADLRVLVAYHDFGDEKLEPVEEILKKSILKMEKYSNRMTRVPDSRWLFIFGPRRKTSRPDPFRAFTLDGTKVVELPEKSSPLIPAGWPE